MFNATNAKTLVTAYRMARVTANLDNTLDQIKYRASHGESEFVTELVLTESECKLLEEQGFHVNRARDNRPSTIIRW
jgi:hypothetical protein